MGGPEQKRWKHGNENRWKRKQVQVTSETKKVSTPVGTALTHNTTTITTQLLLLTGPFAIFLGKSEFHRACAFRNFVQIESADPFPFSFAVLTGSMVVSLVPSLGSDGGCEEQ
jgi:hypothetical protein|tara:strand:+ start:631 stop:969 length:339 start_codon:yes stop_codon:yes gene_type:complete